MNHEDTENQSVLAPWLRIIASICILIQFLFFFLIYNFTANIYVLGVGWFLVPIGLGLLVVSSHQLQSLSDSPVDRNGGLFHIIPYPLHLGWILVSIALALILQQWFATLLAIGFVTSVIMEIRKMNIDT